MKLKTILSSALAVVIAAVVLGLASPFDKFINARGSLYLNIDADNNNAGELLTIATDTSSDVGGAALVTVNDDGNVGIGTTGPEVPLHVEGGLNVGPGGGGYAVFGSTSGKNLAIDNNEIAARDNGEYRSLYLNFDGGKISMGSPVGIGTASPEKTLDVRGGATDELRLGGPDGVPMLHFRNFTTGKDWVLRHDEDSLHFQDEAVPGTEVLTLRRNGRLGIGTTSPNAALTILEGERISLDDNADDRAIYVPTGEGEPLVITNSSQAANPTIRFRDDTTDTDAMMVDVATGRVGIGTDNPQAGLDVVGFYPDPTPALRVTRSDGSFQGLEIDSNGHRNTITAFSNTDNRKPLDFYNLRDDNPDPPAGNSDIRFMIGQESSHTEVMRLQETGTTRVLVLQIAGGADISEQFDVVPSDAAPEPGMVVCIDAKSPGDLIVSAKAYDRTVAGIISGAGGIEPGLLMGQADSEADGAYPVAVAGRVYVWCDGTEPIQPGDLLTTSDVPGHAMKVVDHTKAQGAIIGKAMSSLDSGQGLVLVLVSLQ